MYDVLKTIGEKFRLPGELYSYEVITMGNINSTYKVTYTKPDGSLKSYLFQKVNTHVFKKPRGDNGEYRPRYKPYPREISGADNAPLSSYRRRA